MHFKDIGIDKTSLTVFVFAVNWFMDAEQELGERFG
jgi:hypothetical protein